MGDTVYQRASRALLAAGMILLCCLCGWRSVRLALGMTPQDAEYHFRQWQSSTESGGKPMAELDRALILNPRYTTAWIARGLERETAGDPKQAEADLLRAAEIDRTYLPRWTLANYYLRAGDLPRFWTWTRLAAGMAHDPTALFQLCWRASSDAREIQSQAIPPAPAILRAYLDFLVSTDRLEAAEPVADEICRAPDSSDIDLLLRYCDLALAHQRIGLALKAWTALAGRRLIPQGEGSSLINGDLASTPLGRGFDWRPGRVQGAPVTFDPAAREMRASLSGKQPESCDLVEQYLAVAPGTGYHFRFRYRTQDLQPGNGLSWTFLDGRTGAEFGAIAVAAQPDDFHEQTVTFSTPPDCELARIVLRYRRPAGSMRAEGVAVFNLFSLEPQSEK